MSPRKLARRRRKLFSIYIGHLPQDITKVILKIFFKHIIKYDMHSKDPNVLRLTVIEVKLQFITYMYSVCGYILILSNCIA